MTTKINNAVKIIAVVLIAALLSGNVYAINLDINKFKKNLTTEIPEAFVKNLAAGLTSDCTGLKKSCIYFAGIYEIEGMVEPLVNQLAKETDPGIRVLIALALYKIGTPDAIKAIEKLVKNDLDPKVKKMGIALLNEFQSIPANLNITKN
jgi:HEAT repeat protein